MFKNGSKAAKSKQIVSMAEKQWENGSGKMKYFNIYQNLTPMCELNNPTEKMKKSTQNENKYYLKRKK